MRLKLGLDMEALPRFVGRARGWRKKASARKMWRLFQNLDQRRRVTGNTHYLQLVALHSHLGCIGMFRQQSGQRLDEDHARRRRLLAADQQFERAEDKTLRSQHQFDYTTPDGGGPLRR